MMKTYLKRAFQLSDSGVKGLAKSIWSFFLYYVSFVPPMICVFLFADRLLNGNTGKPVVYLLFMLAATLVMYLVINYNYKTTYDETYQESANLRIDLAEQLSKLPLSYFSKHNLSDLAQTIMADVASIEHAFANAVANSIGFAIYFLVISVALLIMNWKLGLCVLLPVLTSASVLFLTKKLQVRDVNKHYDKLRDISESFQNAIELNQEIKSYGLKEKVEAQMDQQLDESENLQWKAQIIQTIPVAIGQTLSILPIGITATVGLSMLASGQVSILILLGYIIMAAKLSGTTRAAASVDRAAKLGKPVIFACGNAPTALIRLYEHITAGDFSPAFVIGVPVGFVNVVQSKELIMSTGVPHIVARGRKGGSNVAAAIVNALLYMLTR